MNESSQMEIEAPRTFKRLILPKVDKSKNLKHQPSTTSKNFCMESYEYTFKQYLHGSQSFSYRCVNRKDCTCLIRIPLQDNYDQNMNFTSQSILNYNFVNEHSESCKRKHQMEERKEGEIQSKKFESNMEILENFVLKNPLLEPKIVKVEMLKISQKFKLWQIIKVIQDVRNRLFPRDKEKVFSSLYCKALDSDKNNYNLFRGHFKIPMFSEKTSTHLFQEIVIILNNPMMMKLSTYKQWFVDATFKVAPQGFVQILNIIVYIPNLSLYYPACHIFMTHKTQDSYTLALNCLRTLSSSFGNKFKLEPQIIMCDFEDALRNAIKNVFPTASLSGCYFHFTKALWKKISKLDSEKRNFETNL